MPAINKKSITEKSDKIKKVTKSKKGDGCGDWQKVKIKGKVISDDGGGFEGLIGLEVLEKYDKSLVQKQNNKVKKKVNKKQEKNEHKKQNKEKTSTDSEKKIKQKQQKIEKTQGKKRKVDEDEDENAEYAAGRFALLRPPQDLNAESTDDNEDKADEGEDEEIPQLVNANDVSVNNLEKWNGLGVPASILKVLAEKGFNSPTEIQAMTLPAAILGKKDILGAAETGSGKTLAFGIPILAGIMELKSRKGDAGIRKATKPITEFDEIKFKEDRELTPPPEELADYPAFASDEENASEDDTDNEGDEAKVNKRLYALVLTPTRELAVQVRDHMVTAAKYTGIQIAAVFGGLSVEKQERLLRKQPEIVVATPGRLWELYQQENPHLSKLEDIAFLAIDETDRMVEKGHFEELRSLLKVLNDDETKKQSRQNFVFSATLTLVHDIPEYLQKKNVGKSLKFVKKTPGLKLQNIIEELGISQPKVVDITKSQQTAQTLTECRLICSFEEKDYFLYYFIQRHPGRSIVFCNSIECVKRLTTLFTLLECSPLPLHANMIQKQRLKNLERFRDNPNGLLIATDVAARGLDIPNVEHVIHYQVPRTSENYVHRSGRTARANKNGITVMFMEPKEVRNYVKLYKTLDRSEDLPLFPVADRFLRSVKERVNLARDVDKYELRLRRSQSERGWMQKQAEEMDIIIDGFNDKGESDSDDENLYVREKRRDRVQVNNMRTQLKSLLAKDIFPRGFSLKYPTANMHEGLLSSNAGNMRSEGKSAIDTMKDAIQEMKELKKLRNKKKKTA